MKFQEEQTALKRRMSEKARCLRIISKSPARRSDHCGGGGEFFVVLLVQRCGNTLSSMVEGLQKGLIGLIVERKRRADQVPQKGIDGVHYIAAIQVEL